jgi:hypothetical protein
MQIEFYSNQTDCHFYILVYLKICYGCRNALIVLVIVEL